MTELVTTARKGVEECMYSHPLKMVSLLKSEGNKNIFLVDKDILNLVHQWRVGKNTLIVKSECDIQFPEYSPFLYNALVRSYTFDKIVLVEEFSKNDETVSPEKYTVEVLFREGVKLVIELDVEKVCLIYKPPQKKKRRSKRRRKV